VRRAKLYYLRDRVGKRARVRERRYTGPEEAVQPGLLHEPDEATDADGMTAEDAVGEVLVQEQTQDTPGAEEQSGDAQSAGSEEPQGGSDVNAEGEAATEAAPDAESTPAAADADGSSSDAGDAVAGAPAGDPPA
jgi:large subunit ribosomal protein L19